MPLYLIACGPNGNDLDWTRRFFERAGTPGGDWSLHGFAAHYYCGSAGTATAYSTDQWYELLEKSTRMEKLILDQRAAMDQFDPQRKIGLIVDEWGTWHPAPPERKPGHLWQQQSTLRDGLVAAITLDCFNRHAEKVVMANIAQIVNVLQSLILTDGDKMVLTPTYHVFDLYQCHQNATAVRSEIQTAHVRFPTPAGEKELPILAGSATIKGNLLQLSLVNSHATESADVRIDLDGPRPKFVTRRSISAESLTAHNTYDEPDVVRITDDGATPVGAELRFTLKPASVNLFQFTR
jgi:alpha-N-arabinofuranosidase